MRPSGFADILSKLANVKKVGDSYSADCPVPGHQTPKGHLAVKDAGDKALVICQGNHGHDYAQICQAIGFENLSYGSNGSKPKRIAATYDYTDEAGNLLYQVVRYEPKDFRQRRPDGKGGWIWSLKNGKDWAVKLVPFQLSKLLPSDSVYIPEGEKDCLMSLNKLGLVATCNAMGAGKWRPEYGQYFKGKAIYILPHNDDPGRSHAEEVARSLQGVARLIKIIPVPAPHKDVTEWLEAGGTREDLERLVSEAPAWEPTALNEPPPEGASVVVCMADVQAEEVSWLWHPYIPKGKLTLLEGDPGVGKSWLTLAIATAISLGKGLPGVAAIESRMVLLASAEDGLGDTIRPRLDSMGANADNIHAIKGAVDFGNGGLATLQGFIEKVKPVLVIIDPLVAYIGAGVDIHRSNETRAVMAQLADIADKHSVAILAVRHLTKGGTAKAIYRGLGSIDILAACRSALLAGCDPDNPQKRGIVHHKSNLAPMGKAIGYELREGKFYWTGESDLTTGRILAAEDTEAKSALAEAADFLKAELAQGALEANQIKQDARNAGVAERTLNRAKSELGIKTTREGIPGKRGAGKFLWELPGHLEGQNGLHCQDCQIDNFGNVNLSSFENANGSSTVGNLNAALRGRRDD